jgi:hypothetical protein
MSAVRSTMSLSLSPLSLDSSWAGNGTPRSARSGRTRSASGEDYKPTPLPFIVAAVGCLLMAWMLAGLMGHLADVTIRGGVISAFFVWVGFVLTTTATNQAFRGTKPIVTVIDTGHWLAVLVVMGAIIGALGARKPEFSLRRMIVACLAAVHNKSKLHNESGLRSA